MQPRLLENGQVCVDMGPPILTASRIPTTIPPTQVRISQLKLLPTAGGVTAPMLRLFQEGNASHFSSLICGREMQLSKLLWVLATDSGW